MNKYVSLAIKCAIVLISALYAMLLFVEFNRYQNDKPMLLPIKNTEIHTYTDGTVEINTGLGYKTISYYRDSVTGKEFGHMFLNEKNASND